MIWWLTRQQKQQLKIPDMRVDMSKQLDQESTVKYEVMPFATRK